MSEETKSTDSNDKALVTPQEVEKKVSAAVDEVVPDGLLIEEDGDPFWVIQRVFWGILKTVSLLAILIFLIWLVWRPSGLFSGETLPSFEVETPPVVEKVLETAEQKPWWNRWFTASKKASDNASEAVSPMPVEASTPVDVVVDNQTDAVDLAYEVEAQRVVLVRGIIPESVKWLREAKTIGEVSMSVLRQGSPAVRTQQIEQVIAAADSLFVRSANLQTQLQDELDFFLKEGQAANSETEALEQDIAVSLQKLDPLSIEGLVNQKITSQQNASYYLSNAKIRDTLLRNIQTFDQLLRQRSIPLLNPATELRAN